MKKFILPFLASALFLLNACNYRHANIEDTNSENAINRDKIISFMGIKLGTPNNKYKSIIDSLDNVLSTDLPDAIKYSCLGSGNGSLFDNPSEKNIGTFLASIINENYEKYDGWGIVASDGDSITKIHYIIYQPDYVDSIYVCLKSLYEKQYGSPDEEYQKEGSMCNIGCIWNFAHNQRIYLNKSIANIDWTHSFQRVEIVYQDMNPIQKQEEQARKEREKEKQDSIDAVTKERQNNAQEKKIQQI